MGRLEHIDFVNVPTPADDESPWLYLLRAHVQEWKQHYKLEREAIEKLEASHQRLLDQLGPLSDEAEEALLTRQDQEIDEIIGLYQLRREFIRERQQQELAKL
ncbi:hypothetical protein [Spirosoma rigui]|uniref:hypothetical protein n=1 Tax=Spirosoma rigui TaxID=564064 RepID=UPI0009AFEAD7|nr:hypothetical protein [Spirosoma rigui]